MDQPAHPGPPAPSSARPAPVDHDGQAPAQGPMAHRSEAVLIDQSWLAVWGPPGTNDTSLVTQVLAEERDEAVRRMSARLGGLFEVRGGW